MQLEREVAFVVRAKVKHVVHKRGIGSEGKVDKATRARVGFAIRESDNRTTGPTLLLNFGQGQRDAARCTVPFPFEHVKDEKSRGVVIPYGPSPCCKIHPCQILTSFFMNRGINFFGRAYKGFRK